MAAFPTGLLMTRPTTLVLALPLFGFLCGPLPLWFLRLAVRLLSLLLALSRPLLWLLPLRLDPSRLLLRLLCA